jgi:hypothetical protein
LSAVAVYGVDPIFVNATGPGNATANVSYSVLDFTTIYHYNSGSSVGRNAAYPGWEYMYRGDLVHFWAKIDATSVYAAEHAIVSVFAYNNCTSSNKTINLTLVTGTTSYNPATGRYEAQYEGDWVIPTNTTAYPGGNYMLELYVGYPGMGYLTVEHLLDTKYENVNDILIIGPDNIFTQFTPSGGLVFNLEPLQFNDPIPLVRSFSFLTPVDREGQGVIANLSIAVRDYFGNNNCTPNVVDTIPANNIRMSTTGFGNWVFLQSNPLPLGPTSAFTTLVTNASTTGNLTCFSSTGSYTINTLRFQLWFDSNHCSTFYVGGDIGVLLSIY